MYNYKQKQLIAHYLFCAGHACVDVGEETVKYLDRTPGQKTSVKTVENAPIFEQVRDLSIATIQGMFDYQRGYSTELEQHYRRKKSLPANATAIFWNSNTMDFDKLDD